MNVVQVVTLGVLLFPLYLELFLVSMEVVCPCFLVREDQVSASLDFLMLWSSRIKETADLQISELVNSIGGQAIKQSKGLG